MSHQQWRDWVSPRTAYIATCPGSCPTSCATNPRKFPLVRGDSDTPTDADAPADISAHIDMWRRWRGRWVVLRHRGVGGGRRSVGSDRVGHVGAPADRNAPTSVDAYVRTRDAGRVNRGEHFGNSGKRKYPNSKCGPCPPPETHRDLLAAARVPANRCVGVSEVYRRSSRRCLRLVSCRILHNFLAARGGRQEWATAVAAETARRDRTWRAARRAP